MNNSRSTKISVGMFYQIQSDIYLVAFKKDIFNYVTKNTTPTPPAFISNWHGGPGVCLNQQFIWACHFLKKGSQAFIRGRRLMDKIRYITFIVYCFQTDYESI